MKIGIALKSLADVERLFSAVSKSMEPNRHQGVTYYISASQFKELEYHRLDFEPYNAIAVETGASEFGIWEGANNIYLAHINNAGHSARFMVRAISMADLMDTEKLKNLEKDYCSELENGAQYGIPYEL